MEIYRNYLLETINYLDKVEGELFTLNINLMMSEDMEELNNLFEENESVVFKMEDFGNSSDEKVKIIKQHLNRIGEDLATLKNINNIKNENDLLIQIFLFLYGKP